MKVVTRFAPSPTGFMHVGGVRTALFAWLYAKKHTGSFILRIEDTDKAREVEGAIEHIMESLKWLGLSWNEGPDIGGENGPYLQSERLATYREYAQKLVDAGHAYVDPYTEEEIEVLRKKAEDERRPFLFREHRKEETQPWDGTGTLRFRVPEIKRYVWNDLARGELSAGEEALDDFVILKADGYPTYNFAHVIDDLLMGVTHIIRGEEFIASTPKFLSLYEALGIQRPEIATVPVILGSEGTKKLSKRDGAKDILEYKAEGYLPEAMVNFLALLGWHPEGDEEVLSTDELVHAFDLTRVQKGGARFDEAKLLHINREWMRRLSSKDYIARGGLTASNTDILEKAVPLMRDRAHTFTEAQDMLSGELACLFEKPTLSTESLLEKEPAGMSGFTKNALSSLLSRLETLKETLSTEEAKEALMPIAEENPKENGGRGAYLWPLRYALSGALQSPDPFTLVSILGTKEATARLTSAISHLSNHA